tara:strand:+ start:2456 stop:2917 length:462 start_codon:yes stop_codon:yes gene_type:complete
MSLQDIYTKLSKYSSAQTKKTSAASIKTSSFVKLSAASDLETALDSLEKTYDRSMSNFEELQDAYAKAVKASNDLEEALAGMAPLKQSVTDLGYALSTASSVYQDYAYAANELGIDPSTNDKYAKLESFMDDAKSLREEFQEMINIHENDFFI